MLTVATGAAEGALTSRLLRGAIFLLQHRRSPGSPNWQRTRRRCSRLRGRCLELCCRERSLSLSWLCPRYPLRRQELQEQLRRLGRTWARGKNHISQSCRLERTTRIGPEIQVLPTLL